MGMLTQADLLRCFRDLDRDAVDTAPLTFPLSPDPVITWAVGSRAFIVYMENDKPRGLVFHRDNSSIPAVATMCQWCHGVRGHGGVKMLSVRASERRWVGQYLCAELDCFTHDPGVDDLRETIDPATRDERTLRRIRQFGRLAF